MPRLSASYVAKIAFVFVILVLALHYTINSDYPDKNYPPVQNEVYPKKLGSRVKERDFHLVEEIKPKDRKNKDFNGNINIADQAIKDEIKDDNTKEQEEKTWMAEINQRNSERKALLRQVCEKSYSKHFMSWDQVAASPSHLRPLIANDKHRFIYSIVYKVASTNWERVIVQDLEGFKNVPNQKLYSHHALKWMAKYTRSEANKRLDSYTKFLFVRDPLSRIISGFKDKFVDHQNVVFSKMARFIIKNYRTDLNMNPSPNITFTEFIKYLVDKEGHSSNVHWKPIHTQNYPCEIEYDIIGKLEDAHEDIQYVLKRVGIYNLTDYGKGPPKKQSQDLIGEYYSQLPTDLLHKLYELYEPDFKLFGYDMPASFTNVKQ